MTTGQDLWIGGVNRHAYNPQVHPNTQVVSISNSLESNETMVWDKCMLSW